VQSSMDVRGTIMGEDAGSGNIDNIVLRLTLVAGGEPVDLDPAGDVVISYTDNTQFINTLTYTLAWVGANDGDSLLEGDEQAELTIDVSGATLGANTDFNLEIVPPDGAVLTLNMNTPAALETWNALR
jgi:flagellin FlaB